MKRKGRLTWLLALLAAISLLAAACGDSSNSSSDGDSGSATTSPEQGEQGDAATQALEDASGTITGSGASFPDAVYQEAIGGLSDVAPDLTVTYNAIGSGSGKEEFGQGLNDFAGTDSLVEEGDGPEEGSFFYIPSTAASVTAAYNLPDVEELQLDGPTLAMIFQRDITTWDDPAIAEINPDVELPATDITVARRSDGSGTTANFTAYLESAAPDVWTLGSDDTVEWSADTQGGQQNTGVAQIVEQTEGAIGYVDLGDATVLELQTALIENMEGNFVAPSVEATTAALDGAEMDEDLTYDPLNGPGEDAYPITAPTYLLVKQAYDDAQVGENVVAFAKWLITEGVSTYGPDLGFAPIPESFVEKSMEQLDMVETGG